MFHRRISGIETDRLRQRLTTARRGGRLGSLPGESATVVFCRAERQWLRLTGQRRLERVVRGVSLISFAVSRQRKDSSTRVTGWSPRHKGPNHNSVALYKSCGSPLLGSTQYYGRCELAVASGWRRNGNEYDGLSLPFPLRRWVMNAYRSPPQGKPPGHAAQAIDGIAAVSLSGPN